MRPGDAISVNPAPRGSNVRTSNQKSRRRGYGQRKRGQFYQEVCQIRKDWVRNKEDHPRGYLFETHHQVFPVPAPSALDLSQPGVRVLPSGVVDHFIDINVTHVPIPQATPTAQQVRSKFKRARVPLSSSGKKSSKLNTTFTSEFS